MDIIHEKIYKLMQHQGKVERNKLILSSNNILGFGFWKFQNNACEGRTYLFLDGRMITQVSLREATTLLLKKAIRWEFFLVLHINTIAWMHLTFEHGLWLNNNIWKMKKITRRLQLFVIQYKH